MRLTIQSHAFGEKVEVDELLRELEICSRAEAQRLIKQGAVEIDGKKVEGTAHIFDKSILHVGKKIWRELRLPPREVTIDKRGNRVKILNIGGD